MANTFDRDPYPFQPRTWLLALLYLPPDATEEQYLQAFEQQVRPIINGDTSALRQKALSEIMVEKGVDRAKAWDIAAVRHPALFGVTKAAGKAVKPAGQGMPVRHHTDATEQYTIGAANSATPAQKAAALTLRAKRVDAALEQAIAESRITPGERHKVRETLIAAANDSDLNRMLHSLASAETRLPSGKSLSQNIAERSRTGR